jgi:FixJ family two-component response regulator
MSMTPKAIIHLVDDDVSVLHSLSALVDTIGHECRCFESAEAFLENFEPDNIGCVITDLRLQGMDGLALQKELLAKQSTFPIIIISGHANVAETVEFMENGALTLIKKPYDHAQLIKAIDRALEINAKDRALRFWIREIEDLIDGLTPDEQRVMELIISGKPNKAIAGELEISMRTVDRRRSTVLDQLKVKTAPELAQLLTRLRITKQTISKGFVPPDQDETT